MKKILIVDDSAFMRNVLKSLLMDNQSWLLGTERLEIYDADNKIEALKLVKEIKPDLILLDIVMKNSEVEGIELIKEIKGKFSAKRIIMITSMGLPFLMDECKKYGVNQYLQKPFDKELVLGTIKKTLMTH